LLKLAEELGNVSRACRIMGYHRDKFYEIKRKLRLRVSARHTRALEVPSWAARSE
jgi:hypothetical protein